MCGQECTLLLLQLQGFADQHGVLLLLESQLLLQLLLRLLELSQVRLRIRAAGGHRRRCIGCATPGVVRRNASDISSIGQCKQPSMIALRRRTSFSASSRILVSSCVHNCVSKTVFSDAPILRPTLTFSVSAANLRQSTLSCAVASDGDRLPLRLSLSSAKLLGDRFLILASVFSRNPICIPVARARE